MTDPRKKPAPISLYPGPWLAEVDARAGARGSRSATVAMIVSRYADVCRRELPPIADIPGGQGAVNLLRDTLNGCWLDSSPLICQTDALALEAIDAIRLNGAAAKWGLNADDARALPRWLADLRPAQALAIVDAIERWWCVEGSSTDDPLGGPFTGSAPEVDE